MHNDVSTTEDSRLQRSRHAANIPKPGANELVVEVANTWSNRLVGDARTEGKDYCRTNIAKSLTWSVPWKDTPLLESGLLGPVRLMMTQVQIGRPSP